MQTMRHALGSRRGSRRMCVDLRTGEEGFANVRASESVPANVSRRFRSATFRQECRSTQRAPTGGDPVHGWMNYGQKHFFTPFLSQS